MLLAGLIGAVAGLPISTMAVLDGLLSGIMGGMMGAMFIAMMPAAYIAVTLKIAAVLTASIIFILLIMLIGEIKDLGSARRLRFCFLPQTMFAFDILIFVSLFFLHPLPAHLEDQKPNHTHNYEKKSSNSNDMAEINFSSIPL